MKTYVTSLVALCSVLPCCISTFSDDKPMVTDREGMISNCLSIVRSDEAWRTNTADITRALNVISQEGLTNAIKFLVPHIAFSPVETPDTTMGNVYRVYPVVGCLRQLGRPSVDAIIEYVRNPKCELTPLMIHQMRLVLVAIEGKERAKQILDSTMKNVARADSLTRLRMLGEGNGATSQ